MTRNNKEPNGSDPVLLGNTFPLSCIRRRVTIEPVDLESLRNALATRGVASFWGHANTLAAARDILGVDVAPTVNRPVMALSPEGYPQLNGRVFRSCWVLSPDYVPGFRPAVGEEVHAEKIIGWRVLRMEWNE